MLRSRVKWGVLKPQPFSHPLLLQLYFFMSRIAALKFCSLKGKGGLELVIFYCTLDWRNRVKNRLYIQNIFFFYAKYADVVWTRFFHVRLMAVSMYSAAATAAPVTCSRERLNTRVILAAVFSSNPQSNLETSIAYVIYQLGSSGRKFSCQSLTALAPYLSIPEFPSQSVNSFCL